MAKSQKKRKVLSFKAIRATFMMPICLLAIGAFLYAGGKYSFSIFEKYKEKDKLNQDLIFLKEEEQKLTVDVERLQNPEYVGRYLREKFLYSKNDEYIIKIPSKKDE
jgi:cell division protein FtsB